MVGLWLTVAGVIGWDVKYLRGFFQGMEWVEPPIWWQIGAGVTLLALAVYLARREPHNVPRRPERALTRTRP